MLWLLILSLSWFTSGQGGLTPTGPARDLVDQLERFDRVAWGKVSVAQRQAACILQKNQLASCSANTTLGICCVSERVFQSLVLPLDLNAPLLCFCSGTQITKMLLQNTRWDGNTLPSFRVFSSLDYLMIRGLTGWRSCYSDFIRDRLLPPGLTIRTRSTEEILELEEGAEAQALIISKTLCYGSAPITFPELPNGLRTLVLLNNLFKKTETQWIVRNFTRLQTFYSSLSYVIGNLAPFASIPTLTQLFLEEDVSGNIPIFTGPITYLGLVRTSLVGTIPGSTGFTTRLCPLTILKISDNRGISGTVPQGLFTGCSSLSIIDLQNNALSGTVPTFASPKLRVVDLSFNKFTGTIPISLQSNTQLKSLSLSNNQLTGTIPRIPCLESLDLGYNQLQGNFFSPNCSKSLFNRTLFDVDLSSNKLTGTIAWEMFSRNLTNLRLSLNSFKGGIPLNFFISVPALITLDISHNNFTGPLPDTYYAENDDPVARKRSLDFSFNAFTGDGTSYPVLYQNFIGNRLTQTLPNTPNIFLYETRSEQLEAPAPQIFQFFPQDSDECSSGTHSCPRLSACIDGWSPRLGYTCQCFVGYSLENQTGSTLFKTASDTANASCVPICGDGIWVPGELCEKMWTGCSETCTPLPGYNCNSRQCYGTCGDGIVVNGEECDNNKTTWCINCKIAVGWKCYQDLRNFDEITCDDINECVTGDYALVNASNRLYSRPCESATKCVNYLNGTFSCCDPGFENLDPLKGEFCTDINECEDPALHNCATSWKCINLVPGFMCCPEGYKAGPNGTCVDLDECNDFEDQDLWRYPQKEATACSYRAQCINTEGSFECCPYELRWNGTGCSGCEDPSQSTPWTAYFTESITQVTLELYPSITNRSGCSLELSDNCQKLDYLTCGGDPCGVPNGGTRMNTRKAGYYDGCPAQGFGSSCATVSTCSYPCRSLNNELYGAGFTVWLTAELSKGDFLSNVFSVLYGAQINITTKSKRQTPNGVSMFSIQQCDPSKQAEMLQFLQDITHDLAPNMEQPVWALKDCEAYVVPPGNKPSSPVAIIASVVAGSVVALILLGLLLYFLLRKDGLDWLDIPDEVSWSFKKFESEPRSWDFRGTKESGYYYKEFAINSKDYARARALFNEYLKGESLTVRSITAVYNRTLLSNFLGTWVILKDRIINNPRLFASSMWRTEQELVTLSLRNWVYDCCQNRIKEFKVGTSDVSIPIVPTIHGTSYGTATAIVETGFAALSSLDEGYYGKGIYFTTYALYATTYVISMKDPAMLISFVIPGSTFPVCEHHKGPNTLLGKALMSGYNSHYVVTEKDGTVPDRAGKSNCFDEIVVSQESQIAPAFIFRLDKKNLVSVHKGWQKSGQRESIVGEPLNDFSQSTVSLEDPQQSVDVSLDVDFVFH